MVEEGAIHLRNLIGKMDVIKPLMLKINTKEKDNQCQCRILE